MAWENCDQENMIDKTRKTLKECNSQVCNIILSEYEFKWSNYETAYQLMIDNYIDEIIKEPSGGAHRDVDSIVSDVKNSIINYL